jgi:tetratricopeptide (TPR) repeat protein
MKLQALFYNALANGAVNSKEMNKACDYYDKAIVIKNCPPIVKISYAYQLIRLNRLEKAENLLRNLDEATFNPKEKRNAQAVNGLVLWKKGQLDQAISLYEKLHQEQQTTLVCETLGYLYLCKQSFEKALDFNLKAYEFAPNNNVIADNLAASYYYLGDFKKARKIYKELIERDVAFPEPYYFYALILNEREKYKLALKYLHIAREKKESPLSLLKHRHIDYMIGQIEDYLSDTPPTFSQDNEKAEEVSGL